MTGALLRAGALALDLGLQMPALVFLSLWANYAGRPAPERAAGLGLSLSFASLFAFIYVFNKTTDSAEDEANLSLDPAARELVRGLSGAVWLCLLLPAAWLALGERWAALGVYAFVGFWGYAYSRPLPALGLRRRLKEPFLVKTLTTAGLGWAPVIVYAPMAFDGRLAPWHLHAYLKVAAVIFALSACWDIRDARGDGAAGVRTLPVVLGATATKAVCLLLLAAYYYCGPAPAAAHRAAAAATAAWVAFSGPARGRGYYHWGMGFWILALLWELR